MCGRDELQKLDRSWGGGLVWNAPALQGQGPEGIPRSHRTALGGVRMITPSALCERQEDPRLIQPSIIDEFQANEGSYFKGS